MTRVKPSAPLAPFIQEYGLREVSLGATQIYRPLPARSDCFLEIYLADRYRVINVATGNQHLAPRAVLVGPHTHRREDLLHTGTLRVFTIRFHPVGFRAIFGIPARLLANFADRADSVLGGVIPELTEQLAGVRELRQLAALAERFLLARLSKMRSPQNSVAIAQVARILKQSHGAVEIGTLAARHNLSVRQLERSFQEHIGISPKHFARLARLNFALQLSQQGSSQQGSAPAWAEIAYTAKFYDQSHMVRDFRELTGETPIGFLALRHVSHSSYPADRVAP